LALLLLTDQPKWVTESIDELVTPYNPEIFSVHPFILTRLCSHSFKFMQQYLLHLFQNPNPLRLRYLLTSNSHRVSAFTQKITQQWTYFSV
jgi:hypothetical protein